MKSTVERYSAEVVVCTFVPKSEFRPVPMLLLWSCLAAYASCSATPAIVVSPALLHLLVAADTSIREPCSFLRASTLTAAKRPVTTIPDRPMIIASKRGKTVSGVRSP